VVGCCPPDFWLPWTIGDQLWMPLRVDDKMATVVGVLPSDFRSPWTNGDQLWMPLRSSDRSVSVDLLAKLRPG
jgi:hypothetical protein